MSEYRPEQKHLAGLLVALILRTLGPFYALVAVQQLQPPDDIVHLADGHWANTHRNRADDTWHRAAHTDDRDQSDA